MPRLREPYILARTVSWLAISVLAGRALAAGNKDARSKEATMPDTTSLAGAISKSKDQLVREIVKTIVDNFNPERIYLSGEILRGPLEVGTEVNFVVVAHDVGDEDLDYAAAVQTKIWEVYKGTSYEVNVFPCDVRYFDAEKTRYFRGQDLNESIEVYRRGSLAG